MYTLHVHYIYMTQESVGLSAPHTRLHTPEDKYVTKWSLYSQDQEQRLQHGRCPPKQYMSETLSASGSTHFFLDSPNADSLIAPRYRLNLVLAVLLKHRKSHFSPLQRHAWGFYGFLLCFLRKQRKRGPLRSPKILHMSWISTHLFL